jgi:hypothetical protein
MAVDFQSKFELFRWGWATILLPVFAWIWTRMALKRRRQALLAEIKGLPVEAKAILRGFYENRTHTMAGNSDHPGVCILVDMGMMRPGPARSMNYTVHTYFTIRADVWKVINDTRGQF